MAGGMSRRTRWILIAVGVILAAIIVPPFLNVNRYRNQVAAAIGRALGRDVSVAGIELKMMPRPGMVLSGFVVADGPSYGTEPMLRADTVTAYLRLSSLWRGKLEIGTLALENPSLNLVRRSDGRWNLEDLVERASQAQSAPTASTRPESKPRFPYVEATAGRINFKFGQTKKAFAFTDADFALWMDTADQWGVRLEARPTRGDVPVSETGILRLEGEFQRAAQLRDTPLKLKLNYTKGQLGQVTALVYGRDRGWRGSLTSSATFSGTPAAMAATMDAQLDDFRRYDIALGEALRLSAHCTGTYSSPDDSLRGIQCQAPVRPGLLMVRGEYVGWNGQAFDLGVTAEQIPLERIVALARHTKKDLPEDLTATGTADAIFTVRRDPGASPVWAGGGHTSRFALQSRVLQQDLELGPIEFAVPAATTKHGPTRPRRGPSPRVPSSGDSPLRVVVKPFAMPLGAVSPASAEGFFDLAQYNISLRGDAELTRLTAIARATGIEAPSIGLAGKAQIDFSMDGAWTGFAPPAPSGKLQVRDALIEMQGVLQPMQVSAASIALAQQSVNINSFSGSFKNGPTISGSASFPLHCSGAGTCLVSFDLHTPGTSLAEINQLVNPTLESRPWYHLLTSGQRDNSALLKLRGRGRVSIGRFAIGDVVASNVSADLEMNAGTLNLREFKAEVMGGHHTGNWDADFSSTPPKFYGSGSLSKVAMAQVSSQMRDPWATGTLTGQYTIGLSGLDKAQLRDSATGSANFEWTSGSFRHLALEEKSAQLSFTSFKGDIAIHNGSLTCQQCELKSQGLNYTLSGTAGLDRSLELRLERPSGASYAISGPLDKPQVTAITAPTAEAQQR
jgi:AsmA family/AsmA-like C-terminal region